MTSVIGLSNVLRNAFNSMVGSGSRSQDLCGEDIIILLTSSTVAGSNDASKKCFPPMLHHFVRITISSTIFHAEYIL